MTTSITSGRPQGRPKRKTVPTESELQVKQKKAKDRKAKKGSKSKKRKRTTDEAKPTHATCSHCGSWLHKRTIQRHLSGLLTNLHDSIPVDYFDERPQAIREPQELDNPMDVDIDDVRCHKLTNLCQRMNVYLGFQYPIPSPKLTFPS